MIIGVDITSINTKKTGTARYIDCLLRELNAFNHEIKKIPSKKNGFTAKHGFHIKYERLQRLYYKHFTLADDLLKENTDCAIFPNYFIAPGYNKPAAIVIHDLSFITHKNFYSKAFVNYYKYELKRTLAQRPIIITVSRHSKNEIIKNTGVSEDNIHIVQAYSNFKPGRSLLTNNGDKYFLYVGHIEPRKNLTFLIENFLKWQKVKGHNIKLKIAGELWIKNNETKNLLKKYADNKSIEFLGYVNEDKLKELYENASAFVHTSFVEGFGFPVLEAMQYNLPVLCSKGTAAEEISKPNSISINPYDSDDLINGFDKLLAQVEKGKRGNNNIPFSPELMRKQLEPVIGKLESKIKKKFFVKEYKAVNTENAILKTLLYSNLFNAGIKRNELQKNLFDVKTTEGELNSALNYLLIKNKLVFKNEFVFINGESNNFYKKNKNKIPGTKLKIILKLLNHIPFISMAAFSGGTANYGLQNHNDVDLFIIAKPNTIFIVYLLIHVFSLIFKIRNELCANYLIDEKSILIEEQDLYTAHQIISLKPFINSDYLDYFFTKNQWVKNYFPNFEFYNTDIPRSSNFYFLFIPFNKIIKKFYKTFYKTKLNKDSSNSIVLEDGIIKLHTNDHRIKTLKEFETVLTNYDWNSLDNKVETELKESKQKILLMAG